MQKTKRKISTAPAETQSQNGYRPVCANDTQHNEKYDAYPSATPSTTSALTTRAC